MGGGDCAREREGNISIARPSVTGEGGRIGSIFHRRRAGGFVGEEKNSTWRMSWKGYDARQDGVFDQKGGEGIRLLGERIKVHREEAAVRSGLDEMGNRLSGRSGY